MGGYGSAVICWFVWLFELLCICGLVVCGYTCMLTCLVLLWVVLIVGVKWLFIVLIVLLYFNLYLKLK